MRFPRIKKVRLESVDGDEKKASETCTDEEIWRIFDEARAKRLDQDSMMGTQSQAAGMEQHRTRGCRFLTPDEYRKKNKKRKTKIISSPSRKVPKVEAHESNVLEGLSFCVLEGVYMLDENSFEARTTQEGGWAQVAEKVRTEEDVIKFIMKHGGSYKAKVMGAPKEYIIGGSKGDARVRTQIDGLNYAKSLAKSRKKADKMLTSVAQHHDGILKWTFVYYLVHKLQNQGSKGSSVCVGNNYVEPEPHHYLVRVSGNESIKEDLFSLDRPITVEEMEHVLTEPVASNNCPWQLRGEIFLPKEDRWVLSARFTSLWQYSIDSSRSDEGAVVVYPDVFSSGYGFSSEKDATEELISGSRSDRWKSVEAFFDEITSVLPLVSAMGGLVTPHLHSGVTHIICLLEDVEIEDATCADNFILKERGRRLTDYLRQTFPRSKKLKLVSPHWMRKKVHSLR